MKTELLKVFSKATDEFFTKELNNLLADVSEINHCAKLGYFLQDALKGTRFSKYHVDPEYNRNIGKVKTIFDSDKNEEIVVKCDLLLHSQGENIKQDNLIAVEMKKKTGTPAAKDSDRKRLRLLTKESYDGIYIADGKALPDQVCGYVLGVYMEIDHKKRTCLFEYYEKGEKTSEAIRTF